MVEPESRLTGCQRFGAFISVFGLPIGVILGLAAALILSEGDGRKQREARENNPPVVITDVRRILMHEKNHYSVFVQVNGKEQVRRTFWVDSDPKLFTDVPAGKAIWIKLFGEDRHSEGFDDNFLSAEFHYRSAEDIGGAGWDHGKFGSGQTTVIK